jgi:glycogen debranching enzyme
VEGSSFSISAANGDILPDLPHGVFHDDTRILSSWKLTVDGQPLEPLTAETKEPYRALFIGRVPRSDGYADSPLIVERLREVAAGMVEGVTIRNYSTSPATCTVSVSVEADFADLFEVKEARVQRRWEETRGSDGGSLIISATWNDLRKTVLIRGRGATASAQGLTFQAAVPASGSWSRQLSVLPAGNGIIPRTVPGPASQGMSLSDLRRQEWVAKIPRLQMANRSIERTLRRSYDDLGALRIEDPAHPERVVVAAGAPWFMTLFGRDSLWASEMALPVDPSLALGTLQTLADRQGSVVDPVTEEEPGKILHEVRLGVSTGLALGGKSVYYGSVDATPQFVMTLGSVTGLEGLLGRHQLRRRHGGRTSDRPVRGPGAGVLRTPVPGVDGVRRRGRTLGGTAHRRSRPAQAEIQRPVLAAGPRLFRSGAGRQEEAGGCVCVQHGAVPVARHRRRRQGAARCRTAHVS